MPNVFARKALLPSGWADDVLIHIAGDRIETVTKAADAADVEAFDCVIPGLANSHSHAFQRALAGRTEERSPDGQDSFWTWRERMYELADAVDAASLTAIASQAFVEMVSSGYTSVAEFHYLHRDPEGNDDDGMFGALAAAASTSGIRMTYVPVLYERAGFDEAGPNESQHRFAMKLEAFLEHRDRVRKLAPQSTIVGIGAHSIRAVTPASLGVIAEVGAKEDCPIHLHIAEQMREVDQSLATYERRPVRWLLENFDVNENWCLVHATHMDREEVDSLAATGAVVSLCPSTEANLGDGLFRLAEFLGDGGRIAIGSDSHVSINPFEELRWLEYGQRLVSRMRNVAAIRQSHVGRELFERAIEGGAQACGQDAAGIVKGGLADLVCLYGEDPMLVGHDDASRLDALVFSGYQLPIERVMVAGDWQVIDGMHIARDDVRAAFSAALASLRSGL